MKIWTCGSSPPSGPRNAWTRIKNVNGASRLSKIWNFFGAIQMISCRDWWPWTKPGYITMTRKQSKNQWSGGIAAHTTPKNSERKNPLEMFSHRFFFGGGDQDGILLIDYLPKGQTSNTEYYSLCWCNWRTFWRKNPEGRSPRVFCSCTTVPRFTGHLQPKRNWPTWASSIFITHPILRIWPRRTTTCSLDRKSNWKVTISRPTRRSLLPGRVACKS